MMPPSPSLWMPHEKGARSHEEGISKMGQVPHVPGIHASSGESAAASANDAISVGKSAMFTSHAVASRPGSAGASGVSNPAASGPEEASPFAPVA
jgi:hypothetical protein